MPHDVDSTDPVTGHCPQCGREALFESADDLTGAICYDCEGPGRPPCPMALGRCPAPPPGA